MHLYTLIALTKISDKQINNKKFLNENRGISLNLDILKETPKQQEIDKTTNFYQWLSKQYNDDCEIENSWESCYFLLNFGKNHFSTKSYFWWKKFFGIVL